MSIIRHPFTSTIISILNELYGNIGEAILSHSSLLQYINIKTKAANRGIQV